MKTTPNACSTRGSAASRREFLRHAASLSAYGAAAPLALQLSAMSAASAQTADDYRALVCIFLYGGNDSYNTLVPYDALHHGLYQQARPDLALARSELQSTILRPDGGWSGSRAFALHPAMAALKPVFDNGKLALGLRVGTLVAPTTLADYVNGRNLPPKLLSHNDQFSLWQTMLNEGASTGWGGRMGDLLAAANGPGTLLTNITVGSSSVFSSGLQSFEYPLNVSGPVALAAAATPAARQLIEAQLSAPRALLLRRELRSRYLRTAQASQLLGQALGSVGPVPMPASPLGASLGMVARAIAARQGLGVRRQVFFVSIGGFDTHASQRPQHDPLLGIVAEAMAAFQTALDAQGVSQQVTTFTASDFGRTLTSNGDGTDHGWGSHVMVMGGAVRPRSWFGALPSMRLGADDDIGQGRLLPAVSVDQYGATLARWMGVPAAQMSTVFPNIGRFDRGDLGFMMG
ncbi:MAG: DUF1501 domain-containing protein [Rubrivivax sp.]|nr:DUF1501 domain-containing protein [Rubrivivax sp.]